MKKILIISYYWPPSGGAGVQRWLKFTRYLPEFGIKPYVVTVDPEKASYPVRDQTLLEEVGNETTVVHTQTNEPFGLYLRITGRKHIPFAGFASERRETAFQKLARFIRGNMFIPDARRGWNSFALKACEKLIREEKIDTVITTSPPHSTQLIGLELKKKYNVKWIADLRDPWTDIYYYKKLLHTKLASAIDSRYEKLVLKNADKVIVVSDFIAKKFSEKVPECSREKFVVIPNGFDEKDFSIPAQSNADELLITYTGTISPEYPLETFTAGLNKFIRQFPQKKVKLRFVGSIPGSMKKILDSVNCAVELIGHVPHAEAIRYMKESSVLLLMIPEVKDNEGILTGKLFEYLAARRPLLCIGPMEGDAARIIVQCKAGAVVSPQDSEKVARVLVDLKYEGDQIEINKYSRKSLTSKLASLL